jgi:hypothetical protein
VSGVGGEASTRGRTRTVVKIAPPVYSVSRRRLTFLS